ncbi:hypothetical protein H6768_05415 [Candidatus Peribacteria bacterium]|nr:hypothetical protein [Candidatus Peribacteria bacterium]
MDKYDITLDDFILNNSWLPLANAGALPSVLQQKLTLSPQVTTTTARVSEIGNPLTHLL